jgi:hypothetical protein
MNDLYKLKYGTRFIPVLEELCTIKGVDYMYFPELLNKESVSVLVYAIPLKVTALGNEINYTDVFLVTNYTKIQYRY